MFMKNHDLLKTIEHFQTFSNMVMFFRLVLGATPCQLRSKTNAKRNLKLRNLIF